MDTSGQYFDYLCRTCMTQVAASSHGANTKTQQQWLSILDIIEECGALRITELLSNTVPQIEVQLSDELPKKICCACVQQLLSAYQFQQICIQSEAQMREQLSKKQTNLKMPKLEGVIKKEADATEIALYPSSSSQPHSTQQHVQHSSIQERLPETRMDMIVLEAAPSGDQFLEHCEDSQSNFTEFVKNEPLEDDRPNTEYNDGDTMHSTISIKDEGLSIESEEQQKKLRSFHHNCHICNNSYTELKFLKKHLRLHEMRTNMSKEYCHACNLCGNRYNAQRYLTRHLRMQHSTDTNQITTTTKQHTCEICDKSFRDPYVLRKHILMHSDKQLYSCPDCGKAMSTAGNLKKHRLIHIDHKPYECPYCPLRFRTTENLARHKKIHEGMEQEACDICGKNVKKSSLKQHKLNHSEEKRHKCEFCEKRFNHLQRLQVHMHMHTGEKPYKCKYCQRAFSSSSIRARHLRIHLGDNVHRCEFCPLAFPAASELRLHVTTHKNEDPETRERNMKALSENEAKLMLKIPKRKTQQLQTANSHQQLQIITT